MQPFFPPSTEPAGPIAGDVEDWWSQPTPWPDGAEPSASSALS
jgi:hypothetical protein